MLGAGLLVARQGKLELVLGTGNEPNKIAAKARDEKAAAAEEEEEEEEVGEAGQLHQRLNEALSPRVHVLVIAFRSASIQPAAYVYVLVWHCLSPRSQCVELLTDPYFLGPLPSCLGP